MRKNKPIGFPIYPFLLFLTIITFACSTENDQGKSAENEPEGGYENELLGRWEVYEAYRDNRPTSTLQDGFFEFRPGGQLTFNLNGSNQKASYTVDGSDIDISGSNMDGTYFIWKFSDSLMSLKTTLRDYNFQFNMKREKTEGSKN